MARSLNNMVGAQGVLMKNNILLRNELRTGPRYTFLNSLEQFEIVFTVWPHRMHSVNKS